MRLGIDYRLITSPENLVNRGIGRYTQQQLRHVLELDGDNEYLLLCAPASDVSLILPEIRRAPNVALCFGPPEPASLGLDPYDRRGVLRRAAVYQDWIHGLDVDLYHATAPFVLDQTTPLAFDVCPMVATIYDFIPLVFPWAYLPDDARRDAYAGAARMVTTAARLIAISENARDDAVKYLGFARGSIDRAFPFADPCFRPLSDEVVAATLGRLEQRVGLPERFLLTVPALHYSKNLELLAGAYGRLSARFRRSLPLVISCHLHEGAREHLHRLGETFGIGDDMILTDYVPDTELAALYNRATLVVHPSRYEGFGLPVVEAMQCGAAVVTTTASSLPEVAAEAAELVDPDDPAALAAAIEGLERDADRRALLGAAGLERARAFTPEGLARGTLDSYRKALGRAAPPQVRPLRIAVCTPSPPTTGEAAVHATDLLRALSVHGAVEVFTEDDDGPLPPEVADRYPTHHVSSLRWCHEAAPFDLVVRNVEGHDAPDPAVGPTLTVVHSDAARQRLTAGDPGAAVVLAPLGAADPWAGRPGLATAVARARLGWSADRFVALLLDEGEGADDHRRALADLANDGVGVVLGDLTGVGYDDVLLACDAVVHVGRPVRGLVRAAAAGKPLILCGAPDDPRWPASFCDRVGPGPDWLSTVAGRLGVLAGDPEELLARSRAARAWFEQDGGLGGLSSFYGSALLRVGGARTAAAEPLEPGGELPLAKLCEVEDFRDPRFVEVLESVRGCCPDGIAARTLDWSTAMAVQALARLGALGPSARILCVGAATAEAALHLTGRAGTVTAAGPWLDAAAPELRAVLVAPGLLARRPFDATRLTVRVADLPRLPFPDGSFDAVVSCRGTDALVAGDLGRAVSEMGRVVQPGGLVALAATVRLHGPPGAPGVTLDRLLDDVRAAGLVPIETLQDSLSDATMAVRRRLSGAFDPAGSLNGNGPLAVSAGGLLGCVHLALRRPR